MYQCTTFLNIHVNFTTKQLSKLLNILKKKRIKESHFPQTMTYILNAKYISTVLGCIISQRQWMMFPHQNLEVDVQFVSLSTIFL